MPLPRGFCKAHATCLPTPDDHRSSLHRKAYGPRGNVEGGLRVNMAALIGCQVSTDWHARLRLTARLVTTSRGGTVAKHSLVVQRCGGWWRAARAGTRVSSLMALVASRCWQRTAHASTCVDNGPQVADAVIEAQEPIAKLFSVEDLRQCPKRATSSQVMAHAVAWYALLQLYSERRFTGMSLATVSQL